MGNFAENLNLGNRFRPPNWKTATLFHRTEKLHKITDFEEIQLLFFMDKK